MNIEIKQSEPSIIAPLCTLIEKHNVADKVLVASFSHRDLETFRAVVRTSLPRPRLRSW